MSQEISVPIAQKVMLSVKECAEYSGLGIHKIQALCAQPDCTFSVRNGRKYLIKREAFDEWVRNLKEI
ncbi:MAG: helix-turn-helix domain-containing protein [Lachnospiraceae bacterium]|nr:helix-turn-helix domain-containing protein [Lachnospiraceae bacterium]